MAGREGEMKGFDMRKGGRKGAKEEAEVKKFKRRDTDKERKEDSCSLED